MAWSENVRFHPLIKQLAKRQSPGPAPNDGHILPIEAGETEVIVYSEAGSHVYERLTLAWLDHPKTNRAPVFTVLLQLGAVRYDRLLD